VGFFISVLRGVYLGYMGYESQPDKPVVIEEPKEEKKPLFGLSEQDLADLDNDNYKGREDEDPRLPSMKRFK
jgi:hypothetical protein